MQHAAKLEVRAYLAKQAQRARQGVPGHGESLWGGAGAIERLARP
jgi:hypothetical protein